MSLSQTIARLKRGREAFASAHPQQGATSGSSRLQELEGFDNPGNLRGLFHVPVGSKQPAPLLVVLHGCTQNAGGYDQGAGWSRLADRYGFALLYPEQKRENNPNLCFNWYQRGDAGRGVGEAASIASMVAAMKAQFAVADDRIFVTGLSAGGAMTSVMLAAYPELFAGGAIIAGLPFGCADNLSEAFECMAGRGFPSGAALTEQVRAEQARAGSRHTGPWPRVSIWHGSADRIVAPANADALVKQWTGLHGLKPTPDRVETVEGHKRAVWLGRDGQELVESFTVDGMAHGTPLMPGTGEGQSGVAQAHMLDVGLSSTDRIAAFFGIGPKVTSRPKATAAPQPRPRTAARSQPTPTGAPVAGIQKTIEDALRSAGLMK